MIIIALNFCANASAQAGEVKAVTNVLTLEAQAVEKGDLAAFDKIWANSEDVTVFESGHANYGKERRSWHCYFGETRRQLADSALALERLAESTRSGTQELSYQIFAERLLHAEWFSTKRRSI